ncbi:hypothetical protein [Streptomyces lydicus]|uniref:hypothetical protein n=1 Tax=Streptomyces lydicus TaxID=47763 RepID=UPI00101146D4|nr:hypothetical protein [Streptomyces lydicus]MCZ1008172.1 hypothetical protein [Streptomyces lydicus]
MSRKGTPPDPPTPTAQHPSDADDPTGGPVPLPVDGCVPNSPAADDDPEHERAAGNDNDSDRENDSEALTRLRARMHQDYARWQQYGPLGRSL